MIQMYPKKTYRPFLFSLVGFSACLIWVTEFQTENVTADDVVASDTGSLLAPVENISPETIRRYEKLGIRLVQGKHLRLFTDLPADKETDRLPQAFDLAVPQWAKAFGVPEKKWQLWKLNGCLMQDPERFRLAGLYPADMLPHFRSGFSRDGKFWMHDQPSPYYRRHLLLHEGVHGFMTSFFPTDSPPWHAEGMAELLATHQWNANGFDVSYFPRKKTEVPLLGRISIVANEVGKGNILGLGEILSYGANAHRNNVPYGWCWAAAAFLNGHPRYQERFRSLNQHATGSEMNDAFMKIYNEDWEQLEEEWLLFIRELEHGYNLERAAITYRDGRPLNGNEASVSLAANRGWQSSGVFLQAGETYRIRATGHYFLKGDQPNEMWDCDPGGITLHYRRGYPVGLLQGLLKSEQEKTEFFTGGKDVQALGREKRWTPTRSGTLYLRINSQASRLHDNSGNVEITVSRIDSDEKGRKRGGK